MEGPEVSLEHLHEEIHLHAGHDRVSWISWVALNTAILAVLAAISGRGRHANEAMMSQIQASDQIAIANATISALTQRRRFWLVSLGSGAASAIFLALGWMAF